MPTPKTNALPAAPGTTGPASAASHPPASGPGAAGGMKGAMMISNTLDLTVLLAIEAHIAEENGDSAAAEDLWWYAEMAEADDEPQSDEDRRRAARVGDVLRGLAATADRDEATKADLLMASEIAAGLSKEVSP